MVKKTKVESHSTDREVVKDVPLLKFARVNYKKYGLAVLEDRAIPDFRDGQIPVTRRILWSTYDMGIRSNAKLVKSARVVGDVLGRFHPHGDSSVYGAVINMTNDNTPTALIQGDGNWGSMSEPQAAAMRYTEMRLSKFTDQVLFNRFYTPTIDKVPNYDGSFTEPLLLPSLLPLVLLNGKYGIAPGATAYIPACTSKSVIACLKGVYDGEELNANYLYRKLRITSVSGGIEELPTEKEARLARLDIFRNVAGRTVLKSKFDYDSKNKIMRITQFANHWRVESLLEKLLDIEGVQEARDDTDKNDKYAVVTVVLKKNILPKMEQAIVRHIESKLLTTRENYVLNFTERYIDDQGQAAAKMHPMSLVTMLTEWIKWRTELEKKACSYWITEADKQIRRLELLLLAVDNLDIIVKMLRSKLNRQQMAEYLKKHLKITVEEAQVILELRVYQLNALEKSALLEQKKKIESDRSELRKRRSNPMPYMSKQLSEFSF